MPEPTAGRHHLLFCFLTMLLAAQLPACSSTEQVVSISGDEDQGASERPHTYFLSQVEVSLERTTCFGTCPAYTVSISGTGHVRYEGFHHVAAEGVREADIPVDEFVELLEQIYRIGFFDLHDDYSRVGCFRVDEHGIVDEMFSELIDTPSRIITVSIGRYTKRIFDHYGTPQEIRELSPLIDEIADTQRWVEGK